METDLNKQVFSMKKIYSAWLATALLALSFSASSVDEDIEQAQARSAVPLILFPLLDVDAGDEPEAAMGSDDTENLVEVPASPARPDSFVIYVVRHLEKEDTALDPALTTDGHRRADGLAQMLSESGIERIYSTMYRRGVGTALPLARRLTLPVEFYQPDQGDALVSDVLNLRQNALIIGHSNTVADLVGAFGGETEELSEDRYGDVFQLLIRYDGDDVAVQQLHLVAPLILEPRRGQR